MLSPSRVSDYMAPTSGFAHRDEPLAVASEHMRRLGIRYQPVLERGRLCGVLAERDIVLAESLPGVAFHRLSVGAAMGGDVYSVTGSAPLSHVVRTMAVHGYGCAVVMDHGAVTGLFTLADGMGILASLLDAQPDNRDGLGASEVRSLILTEHAHVSALLTRARGAVRRLRAGRAPERDLRQVKEGTQHLLDAVQSLLELEDRALAPALVELTGFGRERAQQLRDEHARQSLENAEMASVLGNSQLPNHTVAAQLERAMLNLENDLAREEALLLNLDLLRDDEVVTDTEAG